MSQIGSYVTITIASPAMSNLTGADEILQPLAPADR